MACVGQANGESPKTVHMRNKYLYFSCPVDLIFIKRFLSTFNKFSLQDGGCYKRE